ncbi:transmembrane protein [Cystoisospora suis]|uniref:Transmembrane protein n=1 Tax=Cystoisospora suis TaxID=483139 RepID=A0A2C6KKH3_9APIC|nr:transmembrane protein [Cystoisospora suis]
MDVAFFPSCPFLSENSFLIETHSSFSHLLFPFLISVVLILNPFFSRRLTSLLFDLSLRLLLQIHFAFRLVPSVLIISALSLAYMFEVGEQLYGELHRELTLRSLSEERGAAFSPVSSALSFYEGKSPSLYEDDSLHHLLGHSQSSPSSSKDDQGLVSRGENSSPRQQLHRSDRNTRDEKATNSPITSSRLTSLGIEGGLSDQEEKDLLRQLLQTSLERSTDSERKRRKGLAPGTKDGGVITSTTSAASDRYLRLLKQMEEKCDSFRFSGSWLTGRWLTCGHAMETAGAGLGNGWSSHTTSTPVAVGEVFCFAVVGITLMLLSMAYIDRFESITRIPPYRNRCWLACCAVLLIVIAVTVTARVIILIRSSRGVSTPATTPSTDDTNTVGGSEGLVLPETSLLLPFVGMDRSSVAGRESRLFGYEKGGWPAVDGTSRVKEDEGASYIKRPAGSNNSGTTATLSVSRAALQWPAWSVWLLVVLLWILVVVVDELVKRAERKRHERHQKYLKVLFATRLGMWSPK